MSTGLPLLVARRRSGSCRRRENSESLEEVRRRLAVPEAVVETVRSRSVKRAGGFDPRAGGVPSILLGRNHEQVADAVAAMRLVDYEGCDPAPWTAVVRYGHEEVRRRPDQRLPVVRDEHIGSNIREHAFEATAQHVWRLRIAQLIEEADELFGILEPSRANCHRGHLGRSMKARTGADSQDLRSRADTAGRGGN